MYLSFSKLIFDSLGFILLSNNMNLKGTSSKLSFFLLIIFVYPNISVIKVQSLWLTNTYSDFFLI